MNESNVLQRELKRYEELLPSLLSQGSESKWVCIADDDLLGVFDTPEAAYAQGIDSVGTDHPFLVKEVRKDKEPPIDIATLKLGALHAFV